MNQGQLEQLLGEALETEIGGARVYQAALACAENPELRAEWEKYRDQTEEHAAILRRACEQLGVDTDRDTSGRAIVRATVEALLDNIEQARASGEARLAQIVAAEAVAHAELKDHLNWQLIGLIAKEAGKADRIGAVLQQAYDQVEDQEEEHVFHNSGWARELWVDALGLKAVLPPPEEKLGTKVPKRAENAVLKQRSMQTR